MRLKWVDDATTDGRFAVVSDHVRGEGVCYFLRMDYAAREVAATSDIETAFYGRGGKAKAKAAAQRIVDREAVVA